MIHLKTIPVGTIGNWSGVEWPLDRLDVLSRKEIVGKLLQVVDRLDILGKLYIVGGGRNGCDGRGRDQAGGEQGDCDQSSCHRHKNDKKLGWCMLSA